MQMDLDQLLQFCAYFQINKYASQLTIQTPITITPKIVPKSGKPQKNTRKKIEIVEPKKVQKIVKPKVQIVHKKEVKRQEIKRTPIIEDQDINYFMSHIASQNTQYKNNLRYEEHQQPYRDIATKNYQTFGRAGEKFQYQTFESKMKKHTHHYSKGNLIEKPIELKPYLSRSNIQTPQKINLEPYQYEGSRVKRFWENSVYQTRRNDRNDFGNLIYSPVKRENISPSQSSIIAQLRSEMSEKKSKSKQKRKNSERPFYNASQLTVKEKQSQMRAKRNIFEQSVLSNSFISNEELRVTNNKKNNDEEARRQTSSTYVKKERPNLRRQDENELDDGMEQIISQLALQQRSTPIAISLLSTNVKT